MARDHLPIDALSGDKNPVIVLGDKLWAPAARHLDGIETVLICPDRELSNLPFGAALPEAQLWMLREGKKGAEIARGLRTALPDCLCPQQ